MIYLVATPIGNLKDITLRALEVLRSADYIACEDTRHSQNLLNEYQITQAKLISYHKFNEKTSAENIINLAKQDKTICVISDAGMPGISDPGSHIVLQARLNNIPVRVIPGASAVVSAYALSGLVDIPFTFIGFLSAKKSDAVKQLSSFLTVRTCLVLYCPPHKLQQYLDILYNIFSDIDVYLAKELTKINESVIKYKLPLTVDEKVKGEYVILAVNDKTKSDENTSIEDDLLTYINLGKDPNSAIKTVAKQRGLNKDIVYKEYLKIKERQKSE